MAALAAGGARGQEKPAEKPPEKPSDWIFEPSLYLFLPGLSGTVTVGPIDIEVAQPGDAVLSLNFAFLSNVKIGYKGFFLVSDIFHGDIHAEKTNDRGNTNSGDFIETVWENDVGYQVAPWFAPFAGLRYDYISSTLYGPFGKQPAGSVDWFDPVVGFHITGTATEDLDLHLRADVGGFSIGSKLTWQVFPYLLWHFGDAFALQAGYRILFVDYEQGQGLSLRRFFITELGPQLGIVFTPRF